MPYAVYSSTGHEYFVAQGVGIHPTEPTLVDALTPEMEFHAVNLRVVPVDDKGDPIVDPAPVSHESRSVSKEEHEKAVRERDHHKAENERFKAEKEALEASHKAEIVAFEALLPTTERELKALSLPRLKAVAQVKGVEAEGEDKAAYVAAILPTLPNE